MQMEKILVMIFGWIYRMMRMTLDIHLRTTRGERCLMHIFMNDQTRRMDGVLIDMFEDIMFATISTHLDACRDTRSLDCIGLFSHLHQYHIASIIS